jgi:hypothetical protein
MGPVLRARVSTLTGEQEEEHHLSYIDRVGEQFVEGAARE